MKRARRRRSSCCVVAIASAWAQARPVGSAGSADPARARPARRGSAARVGGAAGSDRSARVRARGSGKQIVDHHPARRRRRPRSARRRARRVVRLGERFTLFITATYGAGVEVNLREPVDLGGAFEVKRKRRREDTTRADGKHDARVAARGHRVGRSASLRIPPLAVTFTSQGKAGRSRRTRCRSRHRRARRCRRRSEARCAAMRRR